MTRVFSFVSEHPGLTTIAVVFAVICGLVFPRDGGGGDSSGFGGGCGGDGGD